VAEGQPSAKRHGGSSAGQQPRTPLNGRDGERGHGGRGAQSGPHIKDKYGTFINYYTSKPHKRTLHAQPQPRIEPPSCAWAPNVLTNTL
jgi:hypothetical protein